MNAQITRFPDYENWVNGVVFGNDGREFNFEAKLYDVESQYGINSGRVSKLHIYNVETKVDVVNYDRGWDIEPEGEYIQLIFHEVLDLLENAPKRFK